MEKASCTVQLAFFMGSIAISLSKLILPLSEVFSAQVYFSDSVFENALCEPQFAH